jgi:hypothetical protein
VITQEAGAAAGQAPLSWDSTPPPAAEAPSVTPPEPPAPAAVEAPAPQVETSKPEMKKVDNDISDILARLNEISK